MLAYITAINWTNSGLLAVEGVGKLDLDVLEERHAVFQRRQLERRVNRRVITSESGELHTFFTNAPVSGCESDPAIFRRVTFRPDLF